LALQVDFPSTINLNISLKDEECLAEKLTRQACLQKAILIKTIHANARAAICLTQSLVGCKGD